MDEFILIKELIFVMLAAFLGGMVASKLKQPVIIGYIFAGFLANIPFLRDIFQIEGTSSLAEIGIALLLFTIGIEFSMEKIVKVRKIVLVGGTLQILLTTGLLYLIFQALGFDSYGALFLGAAFSLSSTAIVGKLLSERDELNTSFGGVIIGWLILQDIAIALILVILSLLAPNSEGGLGNIFEALLKSFAVIFFAIYIGKDILPAIFKKIAKTNSIELMTIFSFALCIAFAFITETLGLSFTLGAFLAGLAVSESFANHQIFSEIKSIRDVFGAIFFVSIGTLFSFSFFLSNLPMILLIVVITLIVKFLLIFILSLTLGKHSKNAFYIATSLVQIGEFGFLIAKVGSDKGWIDGSSNLYSLILASALLTFLITPLLINNNQSFYEKFRIFMRKYMPPIYNLIFSTFNQPTVNHGTGGKRNHIIVCGHGRVGEYVTKALMKMNISTAVIDINEASLEHVTNKKILQIFGDATNIDILENAGIKTAKAVIITTPDSQISKTIAKTVNKHNPNVHIIARIHRPEKSDSFKEVGIQRTVEPEFETAMAMTHAILKFSGRREREITEWLKTIKYSKDL